jgi:hypothetical protein
MVDIKSLIDLQITIFCLMISGYIMTKLNILTSAAKKPMINLIIVSLRKERNKKGDNTSLYYCSLNWTCFDDISNSIAIWNY